MIYVETFTLKGGNGISPVFLSYMEQYMPSLQERFNPALLGFLLALRILLISIFKS